MGGVPRKNRLYSIVYLYHVVHFYFSSVFEGFPMFSNVFQCFSMFFSIRLINIRIFYVGHYHRAPNRRIQTLLQVQLRFIAIIPWSYSFISSFIYVLKQWRSFISFSVNGLHSLNRRALREAFANCCCCCRHCPFAH